jgi:hypothetical protein
LIGDRGGGIYTDTFQDEEVVGRTAEKFVVKIALSNPGKPTGVNKQAPGGRNNGGTRQIFETATPCFATVLIY